MKVLYGPGYIVKNDTTYRVITNHLGSVKLIVNAATGEIVQNIDYDEFGNITSVLKNNDFLDFAFTGGLYDAETGLTRFGARDYDPEIGRWTDKEPLGFAGSNNFYVYCENDPVNSIDPNGLQPSLANDIRDFFGASTDALTTIPFTDYSALDLFGDYGKYNPCSDAAKAGSWYGTAIGLAGAAKSLYSLGKGLLKGGAKKGVQVSESIIKGFT
ncbi:MAG: RHS repeat-associated core domain-containing protein, partial [Ignavibacteria bacterium]|nr:RHS repeat-associated core domain-containing protein [Ignavibacteria bacterium]